LTRIDNIYRSNLLKKIKDRKASKYKRKITNKVNELHWKTIKYITDNYNNVIIGNFSAKSISLNGHSTISKMNKRIAFKMRHYEFKQRLIYKCNANNVHYKEVDEYCTSKMCSKCGNINNNLGGSKIYECVNIHCRKRIDRDINGCRNILMKNIE